MTYDLTPLMILSDEVREMKALIKVRPKQDDVTVTYAHDIHKLLTIKFDHAYCVAHLAELDPHGVVLVCHNQGLRNGYECNQNLYPFFYVGDCYLADKDFKGLTDDQVKFIEEWLQSLKDHR